MYKQVSIKCVCVCVSVWCQFTFLKACLLEDGILSHFIIKIWQKTKIDCTRMGAVVVVIAW